MAGRRVRNVVEQRFVMFDPSTTIGDAVDQLQAQGITYAVIPDPAIELPVLATVEQLRYVVDDRSAIGVWAGQIPRFTPVSLNTPMDLLAQTLVDDLLQDSDIPGQIVIGDRQEVVGVLPRQTLVDVAVDLTEKGGNTGQLEGTVTAASGQLFVCARDNEQRWVSYYRPSNPPTCKKGHRMAPKP